VFRIPDFSKMRRISHIMWDIDGTITDPTDRVNHEVAAKIIRLALDGIYHSFVTGRDAAWVIRNVIEPMRDFYGFGRVHEYLSFVAESGCVTINIPRSGRPSSTIHSELRPHPLATNRGGLRDALRRLVYDPDTLRCFTMGSRLAQGCELIHDANREAYVVEPQCVVPECHEYIWSGSKSVIATLEIIRDASGKCKALDQAPYVHKVQAAIDAAGAASDVGIRLAGTAIDILPVVGGQLLGKSWAAGRALDNLQKKLSGHHERQALVDGTVAVGDGKADFDFCSPVFADGTSLPNGVRLVFVGDPGILPPREAPVRGSVVIEATGQGNLAFVYGKGVIELHDSKGARVVSAVLDFLKLWEYFGPF